MPIGEKRRMQNRSGSKRYDETTSHLPARLVRAGWWLEVTRDADAAPNRPLPANDNRRDPAQRP